MNFIVRIDDKEKSHRCQTFLFKKGYKWRSNDTILRSYTGALYIDVEDKDISYGNFTEMNGYKSYRSLDEFIKFFDNPQLELF